jgi:hypothetical protein
VAKRKKINFRLIDRITGAEPYGILDRMREHHVELGAASMRRLRRPSAKDGR